MVLIRYATEEQILLAAGKTSEVFSGNIVIRMVSEVSASTLANQTMHIALGVIDSHGQGARIRSTLSQACWHAYCIFFDEIFELAPHAMIVWGTRIISREGNWIDKRVSSTHLQSDMCHCSEQTDLMLAIDRKRIKTKRSPLHATRYSTPMGIEQSIQVVTDPILFELPEEGE